MSPLPDLADSEPVLARKESREECLAGGAQRVSERGEEEEAAQHHLVGCSRDRILKAKTRKNRVSFSQSLGRR
jgi:hypothetical protein